MPPWGRYSYRMAPQGYIALSNRYTRRYDKITSSIANKTKCVDDTLLWSDTIKESFQAANWLDTCSRQEITLNPEKFCFTQDEVKFAGFEITSDTVRPCITSWFGLVNVATLPGTTQAQQIIPLGRNFLASIQTVENHHQ